MTSRYEEARARLKRFAEGVILHADTFFSMLDNNPHLRNVPLTGVLDPEDWALMRHNARKIVAAIETGAQLDHEWLENIDRAAAHGAGHA